MAKSGVRAGHRARPRILEPHPSSRLRKNLHCPVFFFVEVQNYLYLCSIRIYITEKTKTMIVDKLENLGLYGSLSPLLKEVAAWIGQHDLNKLENGRHEIMGCRLYVNVEDDRGKRPDEAVIEYHRRMIDVQVPLNRAETYGYTPVADLPVVSFDTEKDIAKVPGVSPRSRVTVEPGEFAIFFPQDGHAPCIAEGMIHKAVFKVEK